MLRSRIASSASVTSEPATIRAKISAVEPIASQAARLSRPSPSLRPGTSSRTDDVGSATGNSPGLNSLSTSCLSLTEFVDCIVMSGLSGDQRLQDLVQIDVRQRLVEWRAQPRRRKVPDVEDE